MTFWTTSAHAGCMLYLHGDSGTTYDYIHLNNDLTAGNDNKGKCVAGTAYAKGLVDGQHVEAAQPVGYVGDSGDANGIHPHLHFEVHPHDGKAVSPFPFLKKAQHLLFAAPPGAEVSVALKGTLLTADGVALGRPGRHAPRLDRTAGREGEPARDPRRRSRPRHRHARSSAGRCASRRAERRSRSTRSSGSTGR